MSQMIEGPRKTFIAAASIGARLRVKITDATTKPPTINVAGVSDPSIGVTEAFVAAAGDNVAILLANASGTRKMSASEAITGGNTVYAAASGQVASTGTVVEGEAMETTTADGDIFEVLGTHNSDISTAIAGTTAVGFEVDTDSSTPKIKLLSVAAGTGDFTTTLTPEGTLSGDNTITVPESDGDTLAALALAQTYTAISTMADDIDLAFGGSDDVLMRFSTADDSDHAFVLGLDDTSQQMHITDKAAVDTDWLRSAGTHPELAIHSNTSPITDYLAIGNHDGTTASVNVVGGTTLELQIAGTASCTVTAGSDALDSLTLTGSIEGPSSIKATFMPTGADAAVVTPGAAIPITNYASWLDSNAGATTQTLADGVVIGHLKKIIMTVAGNNDVVTPVSLKGASTTLTFDLAGEYVLLMWDGGDWVIIESGNMASGTNAGPTEA